LEKLLEVKDLVKHFPVRGGIFMRQARVVRAVDGVDFDIKEGETFGLVGESGCGKTTIGRLILRLIEPTSGEIIFSGCNITRLKREELRKLRCNMQIVYQDPFASLNPRMTIRKTVEEPMKNFNLLEEADREKRIRELLEKVGLEAEFMKRYPHELSGGQRQRVAVARALAVNPKFIVLDEPTSNLDVSVQARILNDFMDLQRELGLTYLFVTHDLAIIDHLADRVAVMYLGKIVELARKKDLYKSPGHPYTRALLGSILTSDPDVRIEKAPIYGDVPSPINPPSGCRFHTRCQYAQNMCKEKEPEFVKIGTEHHVACHYPVHVR